jgi:hypothetical protein
MGILAGGAEAAVKITMTPLTGKTFQTGVGVAATPQAVTLTVVCSDTDLAQCVNPITYQFTMELQGKVNRLSTAPIAGASSVNNTDGYGITPRAGVTTGAGTGKQAIAITLDWAAAASLAPGKYFVRWSLNLSNGSGLNQTFVSSSYASSALEVLGGDKIPVITAMDATPACNYPPANLCVLKGKNLNWPGTEIKIGGFALGIRELSPESVTYVIASNPAIT